MANPVCGVRLPVSVNHQLKERKLSMKDAIIYGIEAHDNQTGEGFSCEKQLSSLIGFVKSINGCKNIDSLYYVGYVVKSQIEVLSNFNINVIDKSRDGFIIFQLKANSKKYAKLVDESNINILVDAREVLQ